METKLERQVRFLRTYAVVATLFCAIFLLSAFVIQNKKQKFEEIDVERINVVEKDGTLRMVISNTQRQHPGSVDGKMIPREGNRSAGMLVVLCSMPIHLCSPIEDRSESSFGTLLLQDSEFRSITSCSNETSCTNQTSSELCYTAPHGDKESYKNSHLIAKESCGVFVNQASD